MKLADLVEELGLQVMTARNALNREVRGGYASDLLSDVLARSGEGDLWITLQVHQNIVAVASMKAHAAIILVGGRKPQPDTLEKAEFEGIPLLASDLTTFELVGRLYGLGIRGGAGEK